MRTPGLIGRVAELLQRAIHTPRIPRNTNLPPMMNQLMGKSDPPVLRNDLHQILLDLLRSRLFGQLQPSRQPHHMRIDNPPPRNSKPRPQPPLPGLPSHPRQPQNLLHRLRNLPPKLLHHNPCRPLNRLRLIPKKSRSPNQLLKLRQGSRSHRLRSRKRLEQLRRDQVHPNIRTLRRQNRRHSQLPRTPVVQRTNHPRISLPQSIQNRRNPRRIKRLQRLSRTVFRTALRRNGLSSRNRPSLHPNRRLSLRSSTNHLGCRHRLYPSRSSISAAGTRTQLKIGVSCSVYILISVSRSCCTRSRKSSGKLVSNATTNSWSSMPNEYVVFSFTRGYVSPIRICSSINRFRSVAGSKYHGRVFQNG